MPRCANLDMLLNGSVVAKCSMCQPWYAPWRKFRACSVKSEAIPKFVDLAEVEFFKGQLFTNEQELTNVPVNIWLIVIAAGLLAAGITVAFIWAAYGIRYE